MVNEAIQGNKNTRPLRDYALPIVNVSRSSIAWPAIQANNLEIKPTITQMVQTLAQFTRMSNDDSDAYIANFLKICDTLK